MAEWVCDKCGDEIKRPTHRTGEHGTALCDECAEHLVLLMQILANAEDEADDRQRTSVLE